MSEWIQNSFGNLIYERAKSKIKVEEAYEGEDFPFFTSGEKILSFPDAIIEGDNLFFATGGKANVKFYEGSCAYSSDTWVVTAKQVLNKYLYYWALNDLANIDYLFFSGSGLKHLQKKDFKRKIVSYPEDNREQEKIAEILSVVDETIEKTEALIAKYCAIREGLLQNLLTDGIDENGNIRSPKTHKYKSSPIGNIPAEWVCLQIKQVMPLQRGFDLPSDKVVEGDYPIAYSNGIKGLNKVYKVKGPCVWTGRSGTIGNVFYTDSDCWVHNTALWVTDFCGNNSKFIYYLLSFCNIQKFSAGTGIPTLNRNDLHIQYVALPDANTVKGLAEQCEIVKYLDQISELIEDESEYLLKLQKQKQGLMRDLLTHQTAVDALL